MKIVIEDLPQGGEERVILRVRQMTDNIVRAVNILKVLPI